MPQKGVISCQYTPSRVATDKGEASQELSVETHMVRSSECNVYVRAIVCHAPFAVIAGVKLRAFETHVIMKSIKMPDLE